MRHGKRLLANSIQSFLEAGDDFCQLVYKNDDLSDLTIQLDRSKILTSGRKGKLTATGYDRKES